MLTLFSTFIICLVILTLKLSQQPLSCICRLINIHVPCRRFYKLKDVNIEEGLCSADNCEIKLSFIYKVIII